MMIISNFPLYCVTTVFLVYFSVDGVLNENKFEVFCFLLVNILVAFYSLSYFFTLSGPPSYLQWIRFGLIMFFSPLNILLGILSYKALGWKIYRKIGTNGQLIHMYRTYQIFLAFLKMDLQFGLTIVLAIGIFYHVASLEFYLDIGFFVITILWAGLGWFAIRHEISKLVVVFFLFALVEPGYLLWKAVAVLTVNGDWRQAQYTAPVIIISGLALVCRALLIIYTFLSYRHFNKGLRNIFEKEEDLHEAAVPILFA